MGQHLNNANGQIQYLEKKNLTLQSQYDSSDEKVKKLEQQLADANKVIQDLKDKNSTLQSQNDSSNTKVSTLDKQLADADISSRAEMKNLQDQISQLKSK